MILNLGVFFRYSSEHAEEREAEGSRSQRSISEIQQLTPLIILYHADWEKIKA